MTRELEDLLRDAILLLHPLNPFSISSRTDSRRIPFSGGSIISTDVSKAVSVGWRSLQLVVIQCSTVCTNERVVEPDAGEKNVPSVLKLLPWATTQPTSSLLEVDLIKEDIRVLED